MSLNHWHQLGLSLAVGVLAVVLNLSVVKSTSPTSEFVIALHDLAPGQRLTDSDLGRVRISGDVDGIAASAIPYKDRAVLYQSPVTRPLRASELILYRDVVPNQLELQAGEGERPIQISMSGTAYVDSMVRVGQMVGFYLLTPPKHGETEAAAKLEYIGPFRILAVGERVSENQDHARSGGYQRILTIAARIVPGTNRLQEPPARLLAATLSGAKESIASVVLEPNAGDTAAPVAGSSPALDADKLGRGGRS